MITLMSTTIKINGLETKMKKNSKLQGLKEF